MSDSSIEKRLYKSSMKFCSVATPKGHVLHFKGGMFVTDNPEYIEFLDAQIAINGFSGAIYIDPNARTITAEQENPMLALKKHFYEQFKQEQAAQLNPKNDRGASVQGKLNAASTSDIAPVAANGGPAAATPAAVLMAKVMSPATSTPAVQK